MFNSQLLRNLINDNIFYPTDEEKEMIDKLVQFELHDVVIVDVLVKLLFLLLLL